MLTDCSLTRHLATTALLAAAPLLLLAGCAAYDGRGLVPGAATAADIERTMGAPAEKLAVAGGENVWFYPHAPAGRETHAVRIGPDGRLRTIEQRLTDENLAKIASGASTLKTVRELLGPPNRVVRMERQQREAWEYRYYNTVQIPFLFYVQASPDGVVREAFSIRDPSQDFPGTRR
jgi:hypothetical protein